MRVVRREAPLIRCLDMVPQNASMLLRHKNQIRVAEKVFGINRALVQMCQIGEFVDYSPEPFATSFGKDFFKLVEGVELGGGEQGWLRIIGVAAEDKPSLKKREERSSTFVPETM